MNKNVLAVGAAIVVVAIALFFVIFADDTPPLPEMPTAEKPVTVKADTEVLLPKDHPRLSDTMRAYEPAIEVAEVDTPRERRRGQREPTHEQQAMMEKMRPIMMMGMRAFQRNQVAMFDTNGDGVIDDNERAGMQSFMQKQGEEVRDMMMARLNGEDPANLSEERRAEFEQDGMRAMSIYLDETYAKFDTDGDGQFNDVEESAFAQDQLERFRNGETLASGIADIMKRADKEKDRAQMQL